jgi:hypothetical protein
VATQIKIQETDDKRRRAAQIILKRQRLYRNVKSLTRGLLNEPFMPSMRLKYFIYNDKEQVLYNKKKPRW